MVAVFSITHDLEIESMIKHPRDRGIENEQMTIKSITLTVVLMLSMIVCAGSVIAVIWINN